MRKFFERMGGAFIKFGQMLALRQDVLPISYTEELLLLLSNVPAVPFPLIEEVFLAEKGNRPLEFFLSFNEIPVGSASIGQVYYAQLQVGGEIHEVAVKIQRPHVEEIFETDFEIARMLGWLLGYPLLAKEFISWTRRELDYKHEALNANTLFVNGNKHF